MKKIILFIFCLLLLSSAYGLAPNITYNEKFYTTNFEDLSSHYECLHNPDCILQYNFEDNFNWSNTGTITDYHLIRSSTTGGNYNWLAYTGLYGFANEYYPISDIQICRIGIQIQKAGTPTGNLWISVYAGGIENTSIGYSENISVSSLDTSKQWVNFTFSPMTFKSGDQYFIRPQSNFGDTSNNVKIYYLNNEGSLDIYRLESTTWNLYTSTAIIDYKIYECIIEGGSYFGSVTDSSGYNNTGESKSNNSIGTVGFSSKYSSTEEYYINTTLTEPKTVSLWYWNDTGWTHYVNASGTYYIDNETTAETYIPAKYDTGVFYLGINSSNEYQDGRIDEINVFNYTLNDSEIDKLYKYGLKIQDKSFLNWWEVKYGIWTVENESGNNVLKQHNETGGEVCLTNYTNTSETMGDICYSFDNSTYLDLIQVYESMNQEMHLDISNMSIVYASNDDYFYLWWNNDTNISDSQTLLFSEIESNYQYTGGINESGVITNSTTEPYFISVFSIVDPNNNSYQLAINTSINITIPWPAPIGKIDLFWSTDDVTYTKFANNVTYYNGSFETENGNITLYLKSTSERYKNFSTSIDLERSTEKLDLTFVDEMTGETINTTVTLQVIEENSSFIKETDTGNIQFDLTELGTKTLRYYGAEYAQRFYYITANGTTTNVTLYLLDNSYNVTFTIIDQYNSNIENATIKALKYDILTSSYIQVEECNTNWEGQCLMHLILYNEYYKFIINYESETVKETNPAYIYSENINIPVVIGEIGTEDFYSLQSIDYELVFNNETNNFRFTYTDSENKVTQGCLYVWRTTINSDTLISSECVSSTGGTILINVTNTSGIKYKANAYVTVSTSEYFLDQIIKVFPLTSNSGKSGLFLIILVTVLFGLMLLRVPALGLVGLPLPAMFGSLLGIIEIPFSAVLGIEILFIVVAFIIGRDS